jgi:Ca2+-binding RTX toxin-like protein
MAITPGTGLVINISYDTSVATAPSGFRTAVDAAVTYLESIFTNPITLNIAVGYGESAGLTISTDTLGQSLSTGVDIPFAQLAAVLPGLPGIDPTARSLFHVTDAEARALGLAGDGAALDGSIGISAVSNFTFDPNNRSVPGQYDAISVIEHELTEVMGRRSQLGLPTFFRQSPYAPLDMFRYAAPGQRLLTTGSGYFSTDGVTMQTQFNDPANGVDGGDWAFSVSGDAFGAGYLGQAGQFTATDLAVMAAIGYTTVSGGTANVLLVPFAPAGGVAQTVTCDNLADATFARTLLAAASNAGVVQVTAGGSYGIGAGSTALVDSAAAQVTVFGGARTGQIVVAGSGGIAFNAGAGAGTVLAAGGNNLISVYPGAGAQNITTGDGNDTISALAGDNTIAGGAGSNLILVQGGNDLVNSSGTDLISAPDGNPTINAGTNAPTIFLGSGKARFNGGAGNATIVVGSAAATLTSAGADQLWMQAGGGVVNSSRADTVIGGAGAITVNAGAGNDFVFAGNGRLSFNGGGGASTILGAAAGTASIVGGAGSVIAIAYGATNFRGGTGAATVAAFGGSVTVTGGSGGGVFLGGPAGNNRLTSGNGGKATLIGGGDGDILAGQSSGGDVFQAGAGNETILAGGAVAANKFYGGSGAETMVLGGGGDQVLAGTGNETIWAGFGADLIAFTNGNHPAVTLQAFSAAPSAVQPRDYISLVGFAQDESGRAIAAATITNGSENIVLSDGTKIQFLGVTGLTSLNFI